MDSVVDQKSVEEIVLKEGSEFMSEWIGFLISRVDLQIEVLMDEASEIATEFWEFRYLENNKRKGKFKETSKLGVRVRRKDKYFTIEWFYNELVRNKQGKYMPLSKYIKKNKSIFSYNDTVLIRFCQPWEVEVVLGIEKRLASYREIYAALVTVRRNFAKLQQRWSLITDDGGSEI